MRGVIVVGAVVTAVVLGVTGCSGTAPSGTASPGHVGSPSGHAASAAPATGQPTPSADVAATRRFAALEQHYGARLGVTAVDTGSGNTIEYRAGERFPFASTNKVFIAAAVLRASSAADLDTVVHFGRSDLLEYAPITSQHVDSGMTVRALIDAALRYSDNTAANLLVVRLGGVSAVERYLRSIGDRTTNVDRVEPDLNQSTPGDPRDTSTPAQFAADLRAVVLGTALDPANRQVLRGAMLQNTTGGATIRAGVDAGWPVADKTGTGSYGVRNDIAVVYPPGREPIVVVVMTRRDVQGAEGSDALVAATAKAAVGQLLGTAK
ncbi:class A beta-lactamase [Curtobacterium sp. ISL-83]|uniref:class A beta-lactamase n=1 Tax=Curtobacterium sp. ISL-83 TaxID=2819145 RepID=UPI001BE5F9D3|nr:class A beta-lactamase [Curtobacterium sp. ISL-83]MBT2503629.1 class A beta-lactamase [Curtobacterium sp. ISL-83]